MVIINSGDIRLEMDLFDILFLLNEEDRYRYIAEIDHLNTEKHFTLNLYEYKVRTIKGSANEAIPMAALREAIDNHNVVMRLMDDVDGNHYYLFDTIDPSLNLPEWHKSVHTFIIEAVRQNYAIIQNCIVKTAELKNEGYEQSIDKYQELLDLLDQRIAQSIAGYQDYIKRKAPKIDICLITTTHYRKKAQKYGIVVTMEDAKIPIFFKDITQKMLYIAALLRYKAGSPLYLHELFNNSRGHLSRSNKQKALFKQWIKDLYNIVVDMDNRSVEAWLKKIPAKETMTSSKKINPLYQAKSDANRCIKSALKLYPTYVSYCLLQTKFDKNNDSYYTFDCPVEKISVDENLQKLIEIFEQAN